jgi:hypothetical protein
MWETDKLHLSELVNKKKMSKQRCILDLKLKWIVIMLTC